MKKPDPISERDLDCRYRQMLDDIHEPAKIAGYTYDNSHALFLVDPVAYRCGLADYISAELEEFLVEIDGEYFEREAWEEYQEALEEESAP